MHPILFTLFGVAIPSFGVMLALGFLSGIGLGAVRAKQFGTTVDELLTWAPLLMLGGLIGAKLLYFVYFPTAFWANPLGTLLYPGGLVWYGGVGGALVVLTLWCWRENRALLTLGDWLAPSGLIGLAFGRVGCFLSGCCFGSPCATAWLEGVAVQYPVGHATHPLWVHPAPLYESALALALLTIILWGVEKSTARNTVAGRTTGVFLVGYGLIRFGLEFLRGDALNVAATGVSASQWISVMASVVGAWLLWRTFYSDWRQHQVKS